MLYILIYFSLKKLDFYHVQKICMRDGPEGDKSRTKQKFQY